MSISATSSSTAIDYAKQYAAFNTYNKQELLYASFLSPEDSLANGNAILQQAAQLLSSKSYETTAPTIPASTGTTSADSSASGSSTDTSTTASTASRQSFADIIAASDDAANAALSAYAKAPAGSSILDFQA